MKRLDEISQYMNQLSFDLKAEMLVAVMAEQRVGLREILASFDGQLKRVWSKDIEFTSVKGLENNDNMLCVHLNRDGIYDTLPEAIFHSFGDIESQSSEEMAKESMKLKAEEKDARSFFQPFENEIFLMGVQLALKENQLFKSINTDHLMGIIPDFWKIDPDLPENYVARLKKMLPLVHQIVGNINLTARSLEFIIKEKVVITTEDEPSGSFQSDDSCQFGVLGKSLLGVDLISGNLVNGFINCLLFSIGPIINPETDKCIKNGSMNRFLNCFYSYFIPFELDVDTRFIFETVQGIFVLDDKENNKYSYLGYNSVIQ